MLGRLVSMFPPSSSHLVGDEILITSLTGTLSYETCVAQTIYDFMNLKTLKSLKSLPFIVKQILTYVSNNWDSKKSL